MSSSKPLYHHFLALSLTTFITLIPGLLCDLQCDPFYTNCSQPFICGDSDTSVAEQLKYPFWGINRPSYCGKCGFDIQCLNNNTIIVNVSSHILHVIGSNSQEHTITVVSAALDNTLCLSSLLNNKRFSILSTSTDEDYSLENFSFETSLYSVSIIYGCPSNLRGQLSRLGQDSCTVNKNPKIDVHFTTDVVDDSLASRCSGYVKLPILKESWLALGAGAITLREALNKGFELNYYRGNCSTCESSGGQCGYNMTVERFTCYCSDKPYPVRCPYRPYLCQTKSGGIRKTTLLIGIIIGVVAISGISGGCLLIIQKSKRNPKNQSIEDSLKHIESLVLKRYTFKYVKKMTKSFREKLGEGGYGAVFKGNLKDGCVVAVKLWKQSKGDDQDFLNEIMSISRTSHVNIVPLLGFCYEDRKRVLIYEFMQNGSLEKFLQGFDETSQHFCVKKLFDITIGIARGLEYLHRGCNTQIVHFDIKPHNILLDEEFTPKISDFGFAKSSKKRESIISISRVRGTVGYIAPELFLRSFGGVSHKSDVYSFGMMVLEMVGCKKRLNEKAENSSEIYFPQWIYKQLEQGTSRLDCDNILNVEEKELERKMILIGLACIQANPMSRPSISRVVEMLEGKVELLEVPPMPTLSSPPRLQQLTDENSSSASFYSSNT